MNAKKNRREAGQQQQNRDAKYTPDTVQALNRVELLRRIALQHVNTALSSTRALLDKVGGATS